MYVVTAAGKARDTKLSQIGARVMCKKPVHGSNPTAWSCENRVAAAFSVLSRARVCGGRIFFSLLPHYLSPLLLLGQLPTFLSALRSGLLLCAPDWRHSGEIGRAHV